MKELTIIIIMVNKNRAESIVMSSVRKAVSHPSFNMVRKPEKIEKGV